MTLTEFDTYVEEEMQELPLYSKFIVLDRNFPANDLVIGDTVYVCKTDINEEICLYEDKFGEVQEINLKMVGLI